MKKIKNILIIIIVLNNMFAGLLSPESNADLNYIHVLFSWEQMEGNISQYTLYIDNDSDLNSPIHEVETTSLKYIINSGLNWDSTYYWKVCYLDECTSVRKFNTNSAISNVESITGINDEYEEGITIFGNFTGSDYYSAAVDKDGNEVRKMVERPSLGLNRIVWDFRMTPQSNIKLKLSQPGLSLIHI